MYSTLLSIAVFAAAAVTGVVADDLTIKAPVLTQCGSAQFTWGESKAPYNLIVVPADAPCDSVIADLGDHQGTSMTWKNINLAAGTKLLVSLEDGNGEEGWTDELTVQPSTDASCLSAAAQASLSSVAAASSSAAATSSVAAQNNAQATGVVNVGNNGHDADTSSSVQPTAIGAANAGILPNGAATFGASGVVALGAALAASLALF